MFFVPFQVQATNKGEQRGATEDVVNNGVDIRFNKYHFPLRQNGWKAGCEEPTHSSSQYLYIYEDNVIVLTLHCGLVSGPLSIV